MLCVVMPCCAKVLMSCWDWLRISVPQTADSTKTTKRPEVNSNGQLCRCAAPKLNSLSQTRNRRAWSMGGAGRSAGWRVLLVLLFGFGFGFGLGVRELMARSKSAMGLNSRMGVILLFCPQISEVECKLGA